MSRQLPAAQPGLTPVRPILMLLLVGCAAPKRIAYASYNADEAGLFTAPPKTRPEGTCPATFRVHVVDAMQRSVAGAQVSLDQRLAMNAPSLVPWRRIYQTVPVVTGADGEAMICPPDRVPPGTEDMFTSRDGGQIEIRKGERTTTVKPPFGNPIVLR